MGKTLSEIRAHNKRVGQHFFDRGNSPVVSKQGDYLITRGATNGFVMYKYDRKTGKINFIDNPYGSYSWEPHKTKASVINYARELVRTKK